MIGFETDLSDLRGAAGLVGKAGDGATVARDGVKKLDVPGSSGPADLLDSVLPFGGGAPTAFGRSLGMRDVKSAYEYHRQKVEEALAKLADTTQQSSRALLQVADLYEEADEDAKNRVNRAAAQLEGN
ncbi:hypothetical protein OG943_04715 [Amycolatopsis sp. NBC_00345]|uniref:hypothetical protein n=1 Tax=Amycolatopsis sp. NBC_00345 TaxID=2975955 RepID=UPI002E266278